MNTKYNRWLEETAADPALRRVVIALFTKRRAILFCIALFMTVYAIAMSFTVTRSSITPVMMSFAAFMSWIVVIMVSMVSADLRVLKLVDHFSSRDEKPTA